MLIICLLLLFGFAGHGTTAQEYRLSKDVVPDAYDIVIKPYLQQSDGTKQFTFDGEVNITLHSLEQNIQNITLHKAFIDIYETILYDHNGQVVQKISNDDLIYDNITDKLTIQLQTPLVVLVNHTLYFNYTGRIGNDLAGIFRGTYDNESWYAITQLHRIDARTAFPCFDEPQIKATFRMRISRPKTYTSYFNTRLLETQPENDDRYMDTFEESPRMSSYLVAFFVGDFVATGDTDLKLIMHSKYTNKTEFAYEVAKETISAYDAYTQMPYKALGNTIMQKVGAAYFPHSGMENWGLVIYQDTVLAQEPEYTDGWSNKEFTIMLLVHEMAHMWFGNSVTHKWWSYFWLNEGFARYYQYFMANEIYPEYEFDKQFVVNVIHKTFEIDATNGTQPLSSPEESIQTPAEIGYKFSAVAYDKGATIIRMISNIMGKENYDNAMRDYLKENHLKSTTPDDLFVHWTKHFPSGHNVDLGELFKVWTEQPGYPIVRVAITSNGRYRLTQERFLMNAEEEEGNDASLKYIIPITYTTSNESNFTDLQPKFYLNQTSAEIEFGSANADEWLILNLQQSNFHRVFYEAPLLQRLRKAMTASNHSGIHVLNRAQLINDLFTYGRIGLMDYDEVLLFMEYLVTEFEYIAWQPAFKGFEIIYQRLTLRQHKTFSKFIIDILQPIYNRLGLENSNDTILDVYNRNHVISWLCKYNHENCITETQKVFRKGVVSNFRKLSPDFRETIWCAAGRNSAYTLEYYYTLREIYRTVSLTSEKEKLLRAMGCSREIFLHYSGFILAGNVSSELIPMAISSMYTQNPQNIMEVYYSVTGTVERLAELLDSWESTALVISGIADYFTEEIDLYWFKEDIKRQGHLFGSSVSILEAAVVNVEKNLKWSEKHMGKLITYLDRRNAATSFKGLVAVMPVLAIICFVF